MGRQWFEAAVRCALVAAAFSGVVACSSSDDEKQGGSPDSGENKGDGGKGNVDGGSADAGGGTDNWNTKYDVPHVDGGALPDSFRFDQVKDPWTADTVDACKAAGDEYPVSRACLCEADACRELMHQCDALQGCIEIRHCIWETGCQDPNSCYLFKQPGDKTGCVDIIDKWGNTGDATAIATATLQCGQKPEIACPKKAE